MNIYPRKVLITGVSGFIGGAVARHFANSGFDVYGVGRHLTAHVPYKNVQVEQMELPHQRLKDLLMKWKPDAIIHCAGRSSVPQSMLEPGLDFNDGPSLTYHMLDSLRQYSPESAFVFLSSASVYGNPVVLPVSESQFPSPISIYGYHKWQSEILCKEFSHLYKIKTASVRLFSAYGRGLRRQVVWDIVSKALTGLDVNLQGTGAESRDFIHVDDIACGLEILLNKAPLQAEVYNLASGNETKISELSSLIIAKLGFSRKVIFSGEVPFGTPNNWRADINLITQLGFKPSVSLGDGLSDFIQWCKSEVK